MTDDQALLHLEIHLRDVERRECERDLYTFVKCAWPLIEPGTKFVENWHLKTVCAYLEAFHRGELPDKRLIINIPPGMMKSILLVCYNAWAWIDQPHLRFLSIANADDLSTRDSLRVKAIITSEWYQKNWPLSLLKDQNEKTLFVNEKRGHRESQGITACTTGKRGDCLLLDDLLDAKHAFSDVKRQYVNDAWDQALTSRLNDMVHSGVILIMQRLHEKDITGHLLSKTKSKWTRLCIPMRYEGQPTFDAAKDINRPDLNDPRTKKGELLFAKRFPLKSVEQLEEDLGEYGTAGQLMQRPQPSGGGILKSMWWRIWPDDIPLPKILHQFASFDTAFSDKSMKDAAFSAMTRWGIFWHEQRQRYCILALGVWWDRVGYEELRRIAKEVDKKHDLDVLLVERKSTGISLIQDLKVAVPGKVVAYTPGAGEDKVSRAHSVSPMLQSGLVYVPNKLWALGDGTPGSTKPGLVGWVAQFPTGGPPSADLCLVAGTMIATSKGNIAIENIKQGDIVLTPAGWHKVVASGCTGTREVITRAGLTGTHNHPVFTFDKGFVDLDTITQASKIMRFGLCDLIKITNQESLSLMGLSTVGSQRKVSTLLEEKIGGQKVKGFMLQSGKMQTMQWFQKALRLITLMGITTITALRIWSAYRLVCIGQCLRSILIEKKCVGNLQKTKISVESGINLKRVESGIERTLETQSANQRLERSLEKQMLWLKGLKNVCGVVKSLSLRVLDAYSAHQNANSKKVAIDVKNISLFTATIQPVYNLTVENEHCYFANGVLVHNCDTVTQALIYMRKNQWIGDMDEDIDYSSEIEHNPTEEEMEDYSNERIRFYG